MGTEEPVRVVAPLLWVVAAFAALPSIAAADDGPTPAESAEAPTPAGDGATNGSTGPRPVGLRLEAELGFLLPMAHTVQFSRDGSEIDYVEEGGQDVLFPFVRVSTQLRLYGRHTVTLLYQPLQLEGREVARRDLLIDGEVFAEGTPMSFRYGFPFWRIGYAYSVINRPGLELGLGGSLQLRNATIEFSSLDGRQLRTNRNVGPVPLLRAFLHVGLGDLAYFEAEADGFYAPVKYINGGKSDVVGAILDSSVRVGLRLPHRTEAFLNVRYLGGGAEGTGDDDGPGDGYNSNWLHFLTLSLGARAHVL